MVLTLSSHQSTQERWDCFCFDTTYIPRCTTNQNYPSEPLFGTFRQSPNRCLLAKMAGTRRRALSTLACLGLMAVVERCLADPCQGVTNGNVENPDDPNCESYIRDLFEHREIRVALIPKSYKFFVENLMPSSNEEKFPFLSLNRRLCTGAPTGNRCKCYRAPPPHSLMLRRRKDKSPRARK